MISVDLCRQLLDIFLVFFETIFIKFLLIFSSSFPWNFILRSGCSAFHGLNPGKKNQKNIDIKEKFDSFYPEETSQSGDKNISKYTRKTRNE